MGRQNRVAILLFSIFSLFLLVGHYGFCVVLPVYFCFREKTKISTKVLVVLETIIFAVLLGVLIAELDATTTENAIGTAD